MDVEKTPAFGSSSHACSALRTPGATGKERRQAYLVSALQDFWEWATVRAQQAGAHEALLVVSGRA